MPLRHQLQRLSASTTTLLRRLLGGDNRSAPSITSLSIPRKLTPIDDVVARVGRDPLPPG